LHLLPVLQLFLDIYCCLLSLLVSVFLYISTFNPMFNVLRVFNSRKLRDVFRDVRTVFALRNVIILFRFG
jgi:hypothetical protein